MRKKVEVCGHNYASAFNVSPFGRNCPLNEQIADGKCLLVVCGALETD